MKNIFKTLKSKVLLIGLEQRINSLENLTKKKIPSKKDNEKYFEILKDYIEWVDGDSTKYTIENARFSPYAQGFHIARIEMLHSEENEVALNLARYARTNKKIHEVKKEFKKYAQQYEVDEPLSEMYFNMALKQLERMEKQRHTYARAASKEIINIKETSGQ